MLRIFRQEAIEHASRRLSGDVVLTAPLSMRLISGVLLGSLVAVLLFASFATYTRKQTVTGVVAPPAGLVRVVAREGGLVRSLEVAVGDRVRSGQILATISMSRAMENGETAVVSLATLEAERKAAEAGTEASTTILIREQSRLASDEATLVDEIAEAERRLALQNDQVVLAQGELDRALSIADQGYLPLREVTGRRNSLLTAQSNLSSSRSAVLALRRQLAQARQTLSEHAERLALIESDADRALAGLDQRRIEINSRDRYVLTAPASGVVVALPARAGLELAAGSAAVIVAPGGSRQTLVAEVFIPSSASAFLERGQRVRIGVEAYPYERYGKISGWLQEISAAPLQPEDLLLAGVTSEEPLYRGVIKLERQGISAYGRVRPLRPGMSLTADIETDRRSLLEWLFDPLYAAARR